MNIYELARTNLPNSWDAIANNSYYGEPLLKSKVDFVKFRIFSTIVDSTIEESVYNPLQMNYAAKYTALQIIPVAMDHYKSLRQTITTTGTNESVSYPDRIAALEKLKDQLTAEVTDLALDLPADQINHRPGKVPMFNAAEYVTENPKLFPRKVSKYEIPSNQRIL